MAHRFTDPSARRTFFKAAPGSTASDGLAPWLETAGFSLGATAEGGSPCSVLVVVGEQPATLTVFAIPDGSIDEAMRADLDRAHRANFGLFFTHDLEPQQFAGVLWCLTLTDTAGVRGLREDLEGEISSYDTAPIDWPAVDAAWGTWKQHEVVAGAGLPGPVTRIYAINHAP